MTHKKSFFLGDLMYFAEYRTITDPGGPLNEVLIVDSREVPVCSYQLACPVDRVIELFKADYDGEPREPGY